MESFSTSPGIVDWRSTPYEAILSVEQIAEKAGQASTVVATLVQDCREHPPHCRLEGQLPTGIGFEVDLPLKWNGRLYMYGNGGYAGEDHKISPHLQEKRNYALLNGFATAWTDTGHQASDYPGSPFAAGAFAQDPVALTNHAHLAVHRTVTFAKQLIGAFYGRPTDYAYWDGCSTGGRQGVMEAQRYPSDFNGVLAGAPTLDWTSIMIKGLWRQLVTKNTGLTLEKLQTVFEAAISKCDEVDGLVDGLIDDPRRCVFDPRVDVPRCAPGQDGPTGLTEQQAQAMQKLYDGPPKGPGVPNWVRDYPGSEHRSVIIHENAGADWLIGQNDQPNTIAVMAGAWMKYFAFKDPSYDPETFDFIKDPIRARGADEEMNPKADLSDFSAAGGKMIIWWGWTDMALNAGMGIDYYDRLVEKFGLEEIQGFCRFFLIPGVAHCEGGYGPRDVDGMPALIDWVEAGVPPERLAARRIDEGQVIYNRAYFAYPRSTVYIGGDPEAPENYVSGPTFTGTDIARPDGG
jgi:hypothetical protein